MKRYHFLLLTSLIVLLLLGILLIVRIDLPKVPEYAFFTIQSNYKVFDLRSHLKKYNTLKGNILTKKKYISRKICCCKRF